MNIKDCPNFSSFNLFVDRALSLAEGNGRPWFVYSPVRARNVIQNKADRMIARGRKVYSAGLWGQDELPGDEPLGLLWVGRTTLERLFEEMPNLCVASDTVIVIELGSDFPEGVAFAAKYRNGASFCFTVPEGSDYLDTLYNREKGDTASGAPLTDDEGGPSASSSPQHE